MRLSPLLIPRHGAWAALLANLCFTACGRTNVSGLAVNPVAASQCRIDEVSRAKLVDGHGRQVYIQPVVAVPNPRGEIFLGGERSYVFGRQDDGRWTRVPEDSLLGAIIPRTGPSELVRAPIPSHLLGSVRAVARDDGTWAVVFAEMKPAGAERSDSVARLWYGVLDGPRWTSLENIPIPPHGVVRGAALSSPVEADGVFSWAVILATPERPSDVLVLQRKQGEWSYQVVPTIFASYAAITYASGSEPLLAVVQPDLELPSDGNSLFLWARRPGWVQIAKVASSSDGEVHDPRLDRLAGTSVLSWLAQRKGGAYSAHAVSGDSAGLGGSVVTLDSSVARGSRRAVFPVQSSPQVWVLDHQQHDGDAPEVRFVSNTGAAPTLIGQIPNPFIGPFAANTQSPSEILVMGGVQDKIEDVVVTLVIRSGFRCTAP
jgi:hypothetical protein